MLSETACTPGECLSLGDAGQIVQDESNGPHDLDKSLEEVGLITDKLRDGFRDRVHQAVLSKGCHIDPRDIPNDADTTLREVRNTIQRTSC
jgi:hypothetical protein